MRLFPAALPLETHSQLSQKRWLAPVGPPRFLAEFRPLWTADDYLRERMQPGVETVVHGNPEYPAWPIKTDALGLGPAGFRDSRPSEPAYALVLGDSFGFGVGVNQAEVWSERLEQRLGQPIVNLSQVGASSLQEARIYSRYGRQIPAPVVFWLFFQNDLKDNLRFARWLDPATSPELASRPPTRPCAGPWHRFLKRSSLAYELVIFGLHACEYSAMPPTPVYADARLSLRFCLDHDICDPAVQTQMLAEGWPLTRQALRDTRAQVEQSGAQLVILIVPAKEQVYAAQFRQVSDLPAGIDPDHLVAPLREFCRAEKLPCLDLTATFRADVGQGPQRYFPLDIHWNAAGHALAAEAVYDFLQTEGLLP